MTPEEVLELYVDALEIDGQVKCPPRRRNLLREFAEATEAATGEQVPGLHHDG